MKLVYLLAGILVGSVQCLTEERVEKLKKWHSECSDKTNVTRKMILKLKAGDWSMNNDALKKWTLCVLNKYGLMSKQGVFKLDTALSMVPDPDKPMMEDFIDGCLLKKIKSRSPKEIAWLYAKCYHTRAKSESNKKKRQQLQYLTMFY